jgi:hypothetical protein
MVMDAIHADRECRSMFVSMMEDKVSDRQIGCEAVEGGAGHALHDQQGLSPAGFAGSNDRLNIRDSVSTW